METANEQVREMMVQETVGWLDDTLGVPSGGQDGWRRRRNQAEQLVDRLLAVEPACRVILGGNLKRLGVDVGH